MNYRIPDVQYYCLYKTISKTLFSTMCQTTYHNKILHHNVFLKIYQLKKMQMLHYSNILTENSFQILNL